MLKCTTPVVANVADNKEIVVENTNYAASRWTGTIFAFTVPSLSFTSVVPRAAEPGQQVSIECSNVLVDPSSLSLSFLSQPVTLSHDVREDYTAKLTFVMPQISTFVGTGDHTVQGTLGDGVVSLALNMVYTVIDATAPMVEGHSPTSGSTCGSTLLTVKIKNVDQATADGITAVLPAMAGVSEGVYSSPIVFSPVSTSITNDNAMLSFTTPAYPVVGPVEVQITLPDGAATFMVDYAYKEPALAKVLKVTPDRSPLGGGTNIVLTISQLMPPETAGDIVIKLASNTGQLDVEAAKFIYTASTQTTIVEFVTPPMSEASAVAIFLFNMNCPQQQIVSTLHFYDETVPAVLFQ